MSVHNFLKVILAFGVYCLGEKTAAQEYGSQGGEIILTPSISGQLDGILWKHHGNKVVEFDGDEQHEYDTYKGRILLNWHNGELTIKGLTDADSGTYQLEAAINKKLQYSNHEVHVIDVVAQPYITCEASDSGTTLLCSADLHPLTQFLWKGPGGSETPGSELFIPGSENQESVYTCVVKNPVGNKTAELSLKECHTEEVSSVRVMFWLIPLILVLILCILLAVWLWCRKKRQKEDRNAKHAPSGSESKDEENTVLLISSNTTPPNKENTHASLDQNVMGLNSNGSQVPKTAGEVEEELGSELKSAVGEEEHVTGAKMDSSVVHRVQENIQPLAHKDQPSNTKVELDLQTSSAPGQAQTLTPPQDLGQTHSKPENQPDPNAEDTKGDTQSSIQTKEPIQETTSGYQTQEPNQAAPEMGHGKEDLSRSNSNSSIPCANEDNSDYDVEDKKEPVQAKVQKKQQPSSESNTTQTDPVKLD
uniref:Ig-like domain-containing protein n=1 Tax=Esox lucius TaxID=8010 RepID=A0AAY5KCV7_ESOLU